MVQHANKLKQNWNSKPQNEHEAHGFDLDRPPGFLQVEVNNIDIEGEDIKGLEDERCHQPQSIQEEEGKVDLCWEINPKLD